jgi:hypothetical protein
MPSLHAPCEGQPLPAFLHPQSRFMNGLRFDAELARGDKLDRLAFNNFLLDQGMLPPDLQAKAAREQFVPAQKPKP